MDAGTGSLPRGPGILGLSMHRRDRQVVGVSRRVIAITYGALSLGLFVLGVSAMAIAMFFGMSRSWGTLPQPWSWVINAALVAQFTLGHSWLLTARGHAQLTRSAPGACGQTLAPTTYVMVAAAQLLALFVLWSPTGTIWWHAHGIGLLAMALLNASAWLLLFKAMIDAGLALQTGTLGWLALWRDRRPTYPALPVKGLFRLTRQPIYVAFTLTLWTVPTWTPDQLVVAIALSAYCVVAPRFKEARHRRRHGAEFEAYSRRVPYWLPWPRPAAGRRSEPHDVDWTRIDSAGEQLAAPTWLEPVCAARLRSDEGGVEDSTAEKRGRRTGRVIGQMAASLDIHSTVGRFRLVALAEAVTWIGLLIGMYYKYVASPRTETGVKVFGMAHGLVFIAFVIFAIIVGRMSSWGLGTWSLALLGSIVPVGSAAFLIWADRTGKVGRKSAVETVADAVLRHRNP